MKILHISDTHGLHRQLCHLPAADVIVHSGDITKDDTKEEVFDFINWFCDLPYEYKIFIAGNHDSILKGVTLDGLDDNCYYLDGSSVVINGLKFHGIPLFVEEQADGTLYRKIANIPSNTDILITHIPPFGIMDHADGRDYGSLPLLEKVSEVQPKFHLFGHIHPQSGCLTMTQTTFSNAALLSKDEKCLIEGNIKILKI